MVFYVYAVFVVVLTSVSIVWGIHIIRHGTLVSKVEACAIGLFLCSNFLLLVCYLLALVDKTLPVLVSLHYIVQFYSSVVVLLYIFKINFYKIPVWFMVMLLLVPTITSLFVFTNQLPNEYGFSPNGGIFTKQQPAWWHGFYLVFFAVVSAAVIMYETAKNRTGFVDVNLIALLFAFIFLIVAFLSMAGDSNISYLGVVFPVFCICLFWVITVLERGRVIKYGEDGFKLKEHLDIHDYNNVRLAAEEAFDGKKIDISLMVVRLGMSDGGIRRKLDKYGITPRSLAPKLKYPEKKKK